jgi:hypothetical protein
MVKIKQNRGRYKLLNYGIAFWYLFHEIFGRTQLFLNLEDWYIHTSLIKSELNFVRCTTNETTVNYK